jgi:hypothetical protein
MARWPISRWISGKSGLKTIFSLKRSIFQLSCHLLKRGSLTYVRTNLVQLLNQTPIQPISQLTKADRFRFFAYPIVQLLIC